MFKILWIVFRFAVAMAPFMFMAYGGKLSIGLWVGSLFWVPIAMALLFQPSEFSYNKRGRRRRKVVDFNALDPMDADYFINEPVVLPNQRISRN